MGGEPRRSATRRRGDGGLAGGLVRRLARRIGERGTLVLDDRHGRLTAGSGRPEVRVVVHDARAYEALLRRGSRGLAESYAEGWWDTDDLTGLVRLLLRVTEGPRRRVDRMAQGVGGHVAGWSLRRPPDADTDRANVAAHYDLPPDLFAVMLDETMTYSCAVFEPGDTSLARAQRRKLERVCTKLRLSPDDHVLEIGTGWGSFALHAAATRGCRVTTTTVSAAQHEVTTRRVEEAGLGDRVRVLDADWRALDGRYDKLASIEMIEAVDWRRHPELFAQCERLLRPDGLFLLQAIVMADRSYDRAKRHDDFIRGIIFPGGCIPSVTSLCNAMTRAGELRLYGLEDIGHHYPPTLAGWRANLASGWDQVTAPGLGEPFRRLWMLYLSYCEAAFLERHISNVQLLIAGREFRPDPPQRTT